MERARAVLTAVDAQLNSSVTTLQALAGSRNLENDDLRSFYDVATRVLKTQSDWLTINLASPDGQQVANTKRPFGEKLPMIVEQSSFHKALRTGKPVIGQLAQGPIIQEKAFVIRVPVIRDGVVKYVLSAVVNPESIGALLVAQRLPHDWIGGVLDGNRRIVSRTVDPERSFGRLASESLRVALDSGSEGWFEGKTIENRNVYTAYNRSEFSGWTFAIGIPDSVVEASYQSSLRYLASLGIMFLAFGVALAWVLSMRTARSIESLAVVASDLGSGRKVTSLVPERIAEVEQVKESLLNAGQLIHERSEALRQMTDRLATELADVQELQKISAKLIEDGSLDLLYREILDAAAAVMHSEMASMQMLHRDRNELELLAHKGLHPESAALWRSVAVDSSSIYAEALRTGHRMIAEDIETHDFMPTMADLEAYRKSDIRAVQSTPLRSRTGRILGVISNHWREIHQPSERDLRLLDIVARQAADLIERKQAEESLRESDRRKDEFLAILGHELRNPLGVISTVLQLMRKRGSLDAQSEELRESGERQVKQMSHLLDDLLDMSRIARGQIRLKKEPCDLVAIVHDVIEDHRRLLEENGLHVVVELPNRPLWIEGDRSRLAQVVGNALYNANKFTDRGGTVTLRLARAAHTKDVILSIRDTGIGMEPDILARAFEPFSQAERSVERSRGGLGLGLTLIKGLVELHEGKVAIASNGAGHGVELTIRLPLSEAPAQTTKVNKPPTPVPRFHRILIIEDNPIAAKSTQMLLTADGHTVEVVHTGPGGIEAAKQFHPEVVLCDIGLPGMDGYEVAREIRQEPGLKDAYLIAVTGYGQEEDQRKAREAGFNSHLTKPVDFEELEKILGNLSTESIQASSDIA